MAEGTATELKARFGGEVVELRNDRDEIIDEIATDGSVAGLRAVINGLDVAGSPHLHIAIRKPSLDDVFLALTGSQCRVSTEVEANLR